VLIVEQVNLARTRVRVARETTRVLLGTLTVEIDVDGLRALALKAVQARGKKAKAGPLYVCFTGHVGIAESALSSDRSDPFAGHVWKSSVL